MMTINQSIVHLFDNVQAPVYNCSGRRKSKTGNLFDDILQNRSVHMASFDMKQIM